MELKAGLFADEADSYSGESRHKPDPAEYAMRKERLFGGCRSSAISNAMARKRMTLHRILSTRPGPRSWMQPSGMRHVSKALSAQAQPDRLLQHAWVVRCAAMKYELGCEIASAASAARRVDSTDG